jgi:hypothetical protein
VNLACRRCSRLSSWTLRLVSVSPVVYYREAIIDCHSLFPDLSDVEGAKHFSEAIAHLIKSRQALVEHWSCGKIIFLINIFKNVFISAR